MDHLQLHLLCGLWEFLQLEGPPRTEAGWEHDLHIPLGILEGDAPLENSGFTQQQAD